MAVTVHGRTREQGYKGAAEYDTIAAVKRALRIPVDERVQAFVPYRGRWPSFCLRPHAGWTIVCGQGALIEGSYAGMIGRVIEPIFRPIGFNLEMVVALIPGMAAREVLKHPQVESIALVDLDPQITGLFSSQPLLRRLNGDALHSPKLSVINADAFQWLQARLDAPGSEPFDAVIIDFPDPSNFSLGKLYTTSFYQLVEQNLAASGQMVVQTTSPLHARRSYWTVVATIEAIGLTTAPYHALVPSFGEWGFVIAGRRRYVLPTAFPDSLRFVNTSSLPLLFDFPPDMARVAAEPNRLSNQALVQTFEQEWGAVGSDY